MLKFAAVTLVACAWAGCGGFKSKAECQARVEVTRHRLEAVRARGLLVTYGTIDLPATPAGTPADPATVVGISPAGVVTVDSMPVAELDKAGVPADLKAELEKLASNRKLVFPDAPPARVLYIAADRAQPLEAVLPLLHGLAAERELRLVVEQPRVAATVTPTPPPWLAAVLASLPQKRPRERADAFAEAAGRVGGFCAPLRRSLIGMQGADPAIRPELARQEVPQAILDCRCAGADADTVDAYLSVFLQGEGQHYLPLPLTMDTKAPTLQVTLSGTISALAAALAARPEGERKAPFRLATK